MSTELDSPQLITSSEPLRRQLDKDDASVQSRERQVSRRLEHRPVTIAERDVGRSRRGRRTDREEIAITTFDRKNDVRRDEIVRVSGVRAGRLEIGERVDAASRRAVGGRASRVTEGDGARCVIIVAQHSAKCYGRWRPRRERPGSGGNGANSVASSPSMPF